MSINKLVVLIGAFMLASFLGSSPADAQVAPLCTSAELAAGTVDCDGDGLVGAADPDPLCGSTLNDCDGDGILNGSDPCNDLDPAADCDGDFVANESDECLATVVGADLVVDACTIDVGTLVFATGCSLTEVIQEDLDDCTEGATNHGKYVSCVARVTNVFKKQKTITGKQKGNIQSCAARSDIGK